MLHGFVNSENSPLIKGEYDSFRAFGHFCCLRQLSRQTGRPQFHPDGLAYETRTCSELEAVCICSRGEEMLEVNPKLPVAIEMKTLETQP